MLKSEVGCIDLLIMSVNDGTKCVEALIGISLEMK